MSATILLSVLAASLAIPQPGSTFPSAALAVRDGDGTAIVRLFVAPDRGIEDCDVVASEFSKADGERICSSLREKRAAKPAEGPDGQAVYGTLVYAVAESASTGSLYLAPNLPADVVLDVQSLPGGASTKSLRVNVLLDKAGKVTQCEAADGESGPLVKAACASLGEQALDVRKADGRAVPYVDQLSVDFVTRQASL